MLGPLATALLCGSFWMCQGHRPSSSPGDAHLSALLQEASPSAASRVHAEAGQRDLAAAHDLEDAAFMQRLLDYETLGLEGQDQLERQRCMRDKATRPAGDVQAASGTMLRIDSIRTIPQLRGAECEPEGCGLFNFTHPWTEDSGQLCAREVPKILHFIWLDHPLPEKYAANIGRVVRANPDYHVLLWVNSAAEDVRELTKALSGEEAEQLKVMKLEEHQDHFANWDILKREPNVGARSDWARLEIVLLYGGIYMDTDVGKAPHFSQYGDVFRWPFVAYSDPKPYGNLCNCVFGAEKQSRLIKLASEGWREGNLHHGIPAGPPFGSGVLTSAYRTYNSAEILMLNQRYMFMEEAGTEPVMSMGFDDSWNVAGPAAKEQEKRRQKVIEELKQQSAQGSSS